MDQVTQFDRLLEQTRQVLAAMRTPDGAAPAPGTEVEPVRGVGSAAGGQVEVVVAGQRVESVTLDPRALRMGADLLGEQLVQAVNAALDDLREQAAAKAQPGSTADPAQLGRTLDELQNESVRSMSAMTEALTDAVRSIQQGGR